MSTPTTNALPQSKPTPGRGPTSVATPSASSPSHFPPHAHPKAGKSPHKPQQPGGTASTTHTPLAASSPANLDSLLHGLGRARAGTFGASSVVAAVGSKNTPGSQDAGTPAGQALAGLGLGLGLGLSSAGYDTANVNILSGLDGAVAGSGLGRSAEAIARRTREILQLLSHRWGRVSQEGLVACVPRLGLDGMWEDGMGSGPGSALMKGKNRNYIIAGRAFSVEVEWTGEAVKGVVMDLTSKKDSQREGLRRASDILRKDLVGWNGESDRRAYVALDSFAANMERLSRLDRLGVEKANCFEALDGIHSSLQKLWDWEIAKVTERLKGQASKIEVEMEVICQRAGRVVMHEGRNIGHRIDYWVERRKAAISAPKKSSPARDLTQIPRYSTADTISSLLLSCEPAQPSPYTSMRVTEDWIASDIAKDLSPNDPANPNPYPASLISWLDPQPTLLSTGEDGADLMDIDATIRQSLNSPHPAVRFVAKLDPPVTLPFQTAVDIYNLLGFQMVQEPPQSYVSLIFPEHPAVGAKLSLLSGNGNMGTNLHQPADAPLDFKRVLTSWGKQGKKMRDAAKFTLFSAQNLYGKTLTELPFAHPSQIIAILPFLRQWTYLEALLRRSMGLSTNHQDKESFFERSKKCEPNRQTNHTILENRRNGTHSKRKLKSKAALLKGDIPSDTDSESEDQPQSSVSASLTYSGNSDSPVLETCDETEISASKSRNSPEDSPTRDLSPVDLSLSYASSGRIDLDVSPLFGHRRGVIRIGANAHVDIELEPENKKHDAEEDMELDREDNSVIRDLERVLGMSEDLGMVRAWIEGKAQRRA